MSRNETKYLLQVLLDFNFPIKFKFCIRLTVALLNILASDLSSKHAILGKIVNQFKKLRLPLIMRTT